VPQDTPSPSSPNAPFAADILTGSLNDAFDAMHLGAPIVSPDNFSNKWGVANTEDALALFSINDARLKD
jgi:hypothetical protein